MKEENKKKESLTKNQKKVQEKKVESKKAEEKHEIQKEVKKSVKEEIKQEKPAIDIPLAEVSIKLTNHTKKTQKPKPVPQEVSKPEPPKETPAVD